jgi:hypothetical protein
MDKHEQALRDIIMASRGYGKWEGQTKYERELTNAIQMVVKTAAKALGVDPDLVGTPLDPSLAPRKPLIPGRKVAKIGRD